MKRSLLLLVILGSSFFSFQPIEEEPIPRPLDPFFFRLSLDGRARMVALALHPDLWVAYDTETCSLYKAWNGKLKFEGAVFNNVPGRQPSTDGYPFIENLEQETRWVIQYKGKKREVPKVHFMGYSIRDNKLTFKYELELENGHRIQVLEYPEYTSKRDGKMTGLVRTYRCIGIPEGAELRIRLELEGLLYGSDLKTNGKFKDVEKVKRHFDWGTLYSFEGEVILLEQEETELTTIFAMNPEDVVLTTGG